jgi:class 3 adenylate cyclase
MGLKDDLEKEVAAIFKWKWEERDSEVVPEDEDLKLGNDAVKLDATVLYADMADSTKLVDGYEPWFAAEIYKTFLHCAAKIIRSHDGVITAYDGDRIMAVYIGKSKNTSAVKSALKINYAAIHIVTPAKKKQYPNDTYELRHVVGIDTSKLFVARTGIRGSNDLVWVGRAANYAAKLSSLPHGYATNITADVYSKMSDEVKASSDGRSMWDEATWTEFGNRQIYRSTWWWRVPGD